MSKHTPQWRLDIAMMVEALSHAHRSLRTFRNVPKDEQEWTPMDDDTVRAIELAIKLGKQYAHK